MPQPSQEQVHVDAILTNMSVAYIQKAENFIAQKVFPVVPVEKQSDLYFKYTKGDWFRDEAEERADSTESAGSGYTLSTDSYFAKVFAFHKDIGDQTRANTDDPLEADADATAFVTQRMMLRQEIQWVSDYFTTGVWATDVVGGTDFPVWNDFTGSDPMEDIELGKETILQQTGFEANTLVLGYSVWRKLKNHPDFLERMKFTSPDAVTTKVFAKYLEIDNVYVAKAIKNTAREGQTTSMSFTHGKHAWLGYVNPAPAKRKPSAGYVFQWKGVSDGLGTNIGITRFRMQHLKADRVEAQVAWTNKVVANDMGYFFSGAVA